MNINSSLKNSLLGKAGSVVVTMLMVVPFLAAPSTAFAAPEYMISCGNVSISGSLWNLSGIWHAYDYSGLSTQYDVSVYSPSTVLFDLSSKDAPDTFIATTSTEHPKNMAGTWSNQMNLGPTSPASISAKLYHGQVSGHESSIAQTCSFTLPPQLTLKKTVINDNSGTATTTDWTLSASGPTPISGVHNSAAVTNMTVNAGSYTLSESGGPTGYTASQYSCVKNADAPVSGNSITLAGGDVATCTITNDDDVPTTATLTLQKTVVTDNGGTAVETAWTLSASGPTPISGIEDSASVTNAVVNPGSYNLSESGPPGYSASDWVCTGTGTQNDADTVTLVAGQSATCTITNDDNAPSLTLIKQMGEIVYRGISEAVDWTLTAVGSLGSPTNLSGTTPVTSDSTFKADTYTLGESGPLGYNASGWVCTGNATPISGANLAIGLGESVTCTITNSDKQPGTLRIIKLVQNDNAGEFSGTATSSDFTLSVTGGNPDPSSVVGTDSSPGASVTIDGGASYSVTETDGPSGYGVSYSADCDAVMPEGGEKTCTVTNNDTPSTQGYLTIRKHVTNDNGGGALASAWTLFANATQLSDGVATLLAPNTYTISEDGGPAGDYEPTSIMCSTDGGSAVKTSSIAVEAGHSYVCTITNDDIRPTLILEKIVVKDDGGQALPEDWTVTATGDQESPTIISGNGTAQGTANFQTGTYSLSESDGPAGYTPDGTWSCVVNGGSPILSNSVTLGLADTAICSITNDDQPGTLIIQKTVINDNGGTNTASNFFFHVGDGSAIAFNETADDDGNALTGENTVTVDAGDYEVIENSAAGYGTTLGADCSGTIANGETKTCAITNNDGQATLHIVKYVGEGNPDATFDFNLEGGNEFSTSTSVTTTEGDGSATISIDAGTYNLQEVSPAGWTLSEASCNNESGLLDGDTIYSVDVAAGDNITCTFYNNATGFDITTSKSVDDNTPDAGQNVTFTLTLSNAGPAEAFNLVTQDVLPVGLSYVSDNGAGAYATSSGTWFISSLPAASSTSLQIVATVTAGAGQTVTNTATTTSDGSTNDYNGDNDDGSVSITVNTPIVTPPPSGGGGGGSHFNNPIFGGGTVLGTSTGQVLGASCGLYMDKHLRIGSRKNDAEQARKLQEFLNKHMSANLPVTGFYGPMTEAVIRRFQAQYSDSILSPWGIASPTGLVYLSTLRQVNLLECPQLTLPIPNLIPWSQNPNAQ